MQFSDNNISENDEKALLELTEDTIIFFFGGKDTTSHLILMLMYYLTKNPETMKKVLSEIE